MKTCSIRFFLKPYKGQSGQFTVYVQVIYNRKKAEISTGIRCKENEWDKTKEEFKHNTILNEEIGRIKQDLYKAKNELDNEGRFFDVKDIKARSQGTTRNRIRLADLLDEYLNKIIAEKTVKDSTITKYQNTTEYLNFYLQKLTQKNLMVEEVGLAFVTGFDEFLKTVEWNEYGDRLNLNTLNKYHARFKAILNYGIKKGYLNRNPYMDFKLSFPNPKREYLTKEEIIRIKNIPLSNNATLDKTRDIFLFSCYTGLRFQDAMELLISNLVEIEGRKYLIFDQKKTNGRTEIPVLKPAEKIIEKYSESKARRIKGKILPGMTNQRVNHYLKIIAELAQIKKPLTHHIARHTCATTVLLDNNVPIETVSHWLGHNSIRTTQIYAKVSRPRLYQISNELEKSLER